MSVITAVTAQNTLGVHGVRELDPEIVRQQIECLFEDIEISAVKIGMVSSREIIRTIGECLQKYSPRHVVVDPVMVSKTGCFLLRPEAKEELVAVLFPLAEVVTPNLFEAEALTGRKISTIEEMERAALEIHRLGPRNVVVKGGHLPGPPVDVFFDGKDLVRLPGERIPTKNTHGTGCTFSSAIAAFLARGFPVAEAVRRAKEYLAGAIARAFDLGHGVGPVHHFYYLYEKAGIPSE